MSIQIVKVKEDILVENNKKADSLRTYLKDKGIYFINVMASPGSGKTTLLTRIINALKNKYRIGVLEADIDGDVDAERINENTGVKVIQVHTSGACHLTAQMVEDALKAFGVDDLDVVILENVGNLVCPAEFDTGSDINMMLLSTSEGHDKPLKYPLMFQVSKIAVISKMDVAPIFDFDLSKAKENILYRNPEAKIFVTSAIKNEGVNELINYLDTLISSKK